MLTIFLLYSNFFAFYALFSPILASPHCSFLLFSCCFFYYYFFVSLYVPVSFASFFLSSSFSFSLSCSVCWQTFREDRNKGRHHCVFTSFPPPPPLLPPPHLFFFRFLVSLKWSFLACSGCCLLCCCKTTQERVCIFDWENGSSCCVSLWSCESSVVLFWMNCFLLSLPPCHSFTVLFWSSKVMMRDEEKMTKVERCHLVPIGWTTVWTSAAGLANKLRHFKAETTIAAMQLKHSANHQNTGTVR